MESLGCPLCGNKDCAPFLTPPNSPGPIIKCVECAFVFVSPIEEPDQLILDGPVLFDRPQELLFSSDPDLIAGSWEEPVIHEYLLEEISRRSNAAEALTKIHRFRKPPGKLLDIGSFCGIFLDTARHAGWECQGIEPLVMPAIYSRAHFGLSVITDTLRKNTFPPASFDVITAFQVFEHMVDPVGELEKIRKILKPNGLLVLEVPNIDVFLVDLLRNRHRHFVHDHVSFFGLKSFRFLMELCGFRLLRHEYPSRRMSLNHFIRWIGQLNTVGGKWLEKVIPQSARERSININLGDIILIFATPGG